MLQQLLHKNNVVIVILINLCSKKFSKTMSAYTIQLQPICDYLQLLLYCPFRNWKNYLIIFYTIFQAVDFYVLENFKRDSEISVFLRFLLDYVQSVSAAFFYDI